MKFLTLGFTILFPMTLLAQNTPRVGNIDPSERDKYRTRFEAKNSRTFSIGPAFASNMNSSDMLYNFGLGYEWEVESKTAVLAQATGAFGSSTTFIAGIIGGKYYFSDTNVSPMIKAGFGFGAAKGRDLDAASGFSGNIGAGMTFFRTSTVHLEGSADYWVIFNKNSEGAPGIGALSLSIHY